MFDLFSTHEIADDAGSYANQMVESALAQARSTEVTPQTLHELALAYSRFLVNRTWSSKTGRPSFAITVERWEAMRKEGGNPADPSNDDVTKVGPELRKLFLARYNATTFPEPQASTKRKSGTKRKSAKA